VDTTRETIGSVAIPDWTPRSVVKEAWCVYDWAIADNQGIESDFSRLVISLIVDERLRPAWARLTKVLEHGGRDPEDVAIGLGALFKGILIASVLRVHTRAELIKLFQDEWSDAKRYRKKAEGLEAIGLGQAEPLRDAQRDSTENARVLLENHDDRFIVERHRTDPYLRGFVKALYEQTTNLLAEPLTDVIALFASVVFGKLITTRQVVEMTKPLKSGVKDRNRGA
jgi:hypothetical protein